AVDKAASMMEFGDILLVEAALDAGGQRHLPAEADLETFKAIRAATARGVTVVEAAGDSGRDLDFEGAYRRRPMLKRREMSDPLDSGAILVGASRSKLPYERHERSSHGSRVDCYAWSEDLFTYRAGTSITSRAAAVVAGAAVAVQGLAQRVLRGPLD